MAQMFASGGDLLSEVVQIDFTGLRFIEPTGVASLANAVEYAQRKGCEVTFHMGENLTAPISYLDDAGFFEMYAGRPISPHAALRGTTSPLHKVTHAESYAWLERSFDGWLAQQLNLEAAELGSIRTCVKEVFNNIADHSGITIGCTHMQHFPNKNEIVIAICDFGIGIPSSIKRKFPDLCDSDAIQLASREGVTSGTTPRNRGVGIDLMIRLVVERNGGSVHIHSGHGKLSCRMVRQSTLRKPFEAPAFYPGTMIEIRLNTTTFVPDDVEQESLVW